MSELSPLSGEKWKLDFWCQVSFWTHFGSRDLAHIGRIVRHLIRHHRADDGQPATHGGVIWKGNDINMRDA